MCTSKSVHFKKLQKRKMNNIAYGSRHQETSMCFAKKKKKCPTKYPR